MTQEFNYIYSLVLTEFVYEQQLQYDNSTLASYNSFTVNNNYFMAILIRICFNSFNVYTTQLMYDKSTCATFQFIKCEQQLMHNNATSATFQFIEWEQQSQYENSI